MQRSTRGRVPGLQVILGFGLAIGAIVLTGARLVHAETVLAPATPAGSTSVPVELRSQEVLSDPAQPPFLPPETFTDLLNAVPAPVVGGLGVEIE